MNSEEKSNIKHLFKIHSHEQFKHRYAGVNEYEYEMSNMQLNCLLLSVQ